MNNKKIKKMKIKNEKMADNLSTIFLVYMFTIFPLVMDDGYLNITVTKYNLFMVAAVVYAVIMALILILRFTDGYFYKDKSVNERTNKEHVFSSDVFMLLFLLAGFLAWIMADNKSLAFSGEMGRRCGFAFIIVVSLVYFALASGYSLNKIVMPVLAVTGILTYLMAILQLLGVDVFGLLAEISSSQRKMFDSTFGNINDFGSYVVHTMALFSGLFIFENKKALKILYGSLIFIGGGAVVASRSDLTYAGIFVCLVILLLVSEYKRKVFDFLSVLFIFLLGYTTTFLLTNIIGDVADELTGLNNSFNHPGIWGIICGVVLLLMVLCKLNNRTDKQNTNAEPDKKYDTDKERHIKRIMLTATACVIAAAVAGIIIAGVLNHWDIFEFDDYWGNYRGFVWSRLLELYKDFPLVNKIFGNGNETVYELMYVNYYDEMYELTGWVYDSAHNQYLQYLVTMGVFGVLSYIGLIVASVYNCIKASKNCIYAFPIMTAIIAFAVQDFFNIGQPVTTPFIFLFAALAAALRRREKV